MSDDVRELADAILHEGYLLYPYRQSALKNCHRYPFGTLYPPAFCETQQAGDSSSLRLECVALGSPDARVSGQLRWLQYLAAEAVVRTVHLPVASLAELAAARPFSFACGEICGELSLEARPAHANAWQLCVQVRNLTPLPAATQVSRDQVLAHALAAAHLLLTSEGGEFVSLIDPPARERELAARCRNAGHWPVLVGDPEKRDMLLAAPIILYDYPRLAPESPGDFFDGTEIDELLTLRVLTLTEEEKREMADSDERARVLLARTEAAGLERLASLHGRLRASPGIAPGTRVRLCPKAGADIFDLALTGRHATVQAIERDFEGRSYVAVTVDDDPGKDLGVYGHRFFFRMEEVELL